MILEKSFGEKIEGIKYKDRVGAYAVIFDSNCRIAVVQTPIGFFLPGGGLEKNETNEDCIKRECLEEAGLSVKVGDFICKGDNYYWSDTLGHYIHGTGYFYIVYTVAKVSEPTEKDHELVWFTVDDCYGKLFLENQIWAVRQALLLQGFNID